MNPQISAPPPSVLTAIGSFTSPGWAKILVIMVVAMLTAPAAMKAQGLPRCGTPDMTLAEYEAMNQQLQGNAMVAGGPNALDIPVWVYVIRNNGQSWANNINMSQFVNSINPYFFNSGMQFYNCGVTYIESPAWYNLQGTTSEWADLVASRAGFPDENQCVKLILPATFDLAIGYGQQPGAILPASVVLSVEPNTKLLAHEMGHYFGLLHTFANPNTQYVNSPVILPNGQTVTCVTGGDFICDTDADPYGPNTSINCDLGTCAEGICDAPDPLGVPYSPDKRFLMSYYQDACLDRFSDQQNVRMVTLFTGHPAWAFLYDNVYPACSFEPSEVGYVKRDCRTYSDGAKADEEPVINMAQTLLDNTGQSCNNFTPITDNKGEYTTALCVQPSYSGNLSLVPDKNYHNDLIEKVDVTDVNFIRDHILGVERFTSPFQVISADANNSGSVTTFDIVLIRQAIKGQISSFPAGSWRYVPDLFLQNTAFSNQFYDPGAIDGPNPFDAFLFDMWQNCRTYNGQPCPPNPPMNPPPLPPAIPNTVSWMDHSTLVPESALGQLVPSWSFHSTKVGDVNCEAGVNGFQEPPADNKPAITGGPHNPLLTNTTFTVSLTTSSDAPVGGWQMGIDFPEDSLQFLEVLTGNALTLTSDDFGLSKTAQGEIRSVWIDLEAPTTVDVHNKVLFKVKMKALQPIADIQQVFRLKAGVLPTMFLDADGEVMDSVGIHLSVAPESPLGKPAGNGSKNGFPSHPFTVLTYPVPFSEALNFDFNLSEESEVSLRVHDCYGKTLVLQKATLPKGKQTLQTDALSTAPSGLYFYTLESATQRFEGKVIKD